jgi:hypothetical protein
MRVIWMLSNTLLITLALRCLITNQLPLHQIPVLSFRLTCVSWLLFMLCLQFLALAVPRLSGFFLYILETPTADMLHATRLLQAIAAAQSFRPPDLVRYVAPLTLVVQNFESVWGTSPIVLVQNTLTLLWLWHTITFDAGGQLWSIVLLQNRLPMCMPGSLVWVLSLSSELVSWGLFHTCFLSLVLSAIVSSR